MDIIGGAEDAIGAGLIGGAGEDHEVGMTAGHVERVIRRQRHKDDAIAALRNQVETMVEELTKEGEPAAERGGQAVVRRDVVDEQTLRQPGNGVAAVQGVGRRGEIAADDIIGGPEDAVRPGERGVLVAGAEQRKCLGLGGDGGGIAGGLVGDQVADQPRLGIDHHATGLGVVGSELRVLQQRRGHGRERLIGRPEVALTSHSTV